MSDPNQGIVMPDAQGMLGLIEVRSLDCTRLEVVAPAGELIQLGSVSERVTTLDRALAAANGFNPHDIPWNHLGLIVALMEDDGVTAGSIWVPLYDISRRVMMRMTQDAIDLCNPRHGYAWYKGFHGLDAPKVNLNDITSAGVSTNTAFLLIYLRDCHKIYEAWEQDGRWLALRRYVARRTVEGALMRQIDQELHDLKARGRRMFSTKSEATRWRQGEVKRLIEKRGKR